MDRPTLTSATELALANTAHVPNESADYRQARNALLAEEIELRRHIERVAELRRVGAHRRIATDRLALLR